MALRVSVVAWVFRAAERESERLAPLGFLDLSFAGFFILDLVSQEVATQDHKRDRPPDGPLAIGIGADEVR